MRSPDMCRKEVNASNRGFCCPNPALVFSSGREPVRFMLRTLATAAADAGEAPVSGFGRA
jgi:hypothetical protein